MLGFYSSTTHGSSTTASTNRRALALAMEKNGFGLLGLEYYLLFSYVLVVSIGGHVGVIAVGVDVFEVVKGTAKAGGVFGLQLDKFIEVFVLTMVVEDLEGFDDGELDAFDVGVGMRPHHQLEDVGGGVKGVGDIVQGRYDGTDKDIGGGSRGGS